ncbi:MAG: transporter [Candidatus Omnitrophica bacterium]|nr:transporter [Candidatus Omnitrophota bacterium]
MKAWVVAVIFSLAFSSSAFAARPLSTDDAGTVDQGHLEFESGFEYQNAANEEYSLSAVLKYGLTDKWDIGVEIPYQFLEVNDADDVDGSGDIVLYSKHVLLEETPEFPAVSFSFSLKTKTGDENKSLGTGELDYIINLILSKELDKIVSHLNFGYSYVGAPEGQDDDDVFSYAWALEYPLNEKVNLVGEVSAETNFSGDFDDNPFAALVGFNYAFSDMLTFDFGVGWGISEASADHRITAGLSAAF